MIATFGGLCGGFPSLSAPLSIELNGPFFEHNVVELPELPLKRNPQGNVVLLVCSRKTSRQQFLFVVGDHLGIQVERGLQRVEFPCNKPIESSVYGHNQSYIPILARQTVRRGASRHLCWETGAPFFIVDGFFAQRLLT